MKKSTKANDNNNNNSENKEEKAVIVETAEAVIENATAENDGEKANENATTTAENATAANDPILTSLAEIEVKTGLKLDDGQLRAILEIYAANDAEYRKALKNRPSLLQAALNYLKETSKNDPVIASIGMNCNELIDALREKSLYVFGAGKTPDQSLYTAMMRDCKENASTIIEHSRIKGYWKIKAEALQD